MRASRRTATGEAVPRGHPSRRPREERGLLRMRAEGLDPIVRYDWFHRIDLLECVPLLHAASAAYCASVRRAGGEDDRQHELKPLVAVQRVRRPPGKGRVGQPEASLACERQRETRSVGQQVPKLRESAPKSAIARSLRCAQSGGSTDVTAMARARRFDRGRGTEQRHGMDRLKT